MVSCDHARTPRYAHKARVGAFRLLRTPPALQRCPTRSPSRSASWARCTRRWPCTAPASASSLCTVRACCWATALLLMPVLTGVGAAGCAACAGRGACAGCGVVSVHALLTCSSQAAATQHMNTKSAASCAQQMHRCTPPCCLQARASSCAASSRRSAGAPPELSLRMLLQTWTVFLPASSGWRSALCAACPVPPACLPACSSGLPIAVGLTLCNVVPAGPLI